MDGLVVLGGVACIVSSIIALRSRRESEASADSFMRPAE